MIGFVLFELLNNFTLNKYELLIFMFNLKILKL
jgi:hypothetical protein